MRHQCAVLPSRSGAIQLKRQTFASHESGKAVKPQKRDKMALTRLQSVRLKANSEHGSEDL